MNKFKNISKYHILPIFSILFLILNIYSVKLNANDILFNDENYLIYKNNLDLLDNYISTNEDNVNLHFEKLSQTDINYFLKYISNKKDSINLYVYSCIINTEFINKNVHKLCIYNSIINDIILLKNMENIKSLTLFSVVFDSYYKSIGFEELNLNIFNNLEEINIYNMFNSSEIYGIFESKNLKVVRIKNVDGIHFDLKTNTLEYLSIADVNFLKIDNNSKFNLNNLIAFQFRNIQLDDFNKLISQSEFGKVKQIAISNIPINKFPEKIDISELVSLSIENTYLDDLPKDFQECKKIRELFIINSNVKDTDNLKLPTSLRYHRIINLYNDEN